LSHGLSRQRPPKSRKLPLPAAFTLWLLWESDGFAHFISFLGD